MNEYSYKICPLTETGVYNLNLGTLSVVERQLVLTQNLNPKKAKSPFKQLDLVISICLKNDQY